MNSKVFDAYSEYYDLIYCDKNYIAESEYIQSLLTEYGPKGGRILEFGSGTGKHGNILAKYGNTVHGIELSAEMFALANQGLGFTCQVGDITKIRLKKKYDVVLSLFHVVSYLTSNRKFQDVFESAASHLDSGGLFIFDFWYTPAVYSQYPEVRVKRMANDRIEITRVAEPKIFSSKNCVEVNYTIFARDLMSKSVEIIREVHPMRHFSLPEIDLIAEINGFKILKAEEFLTRNEPSEETWAVCVILQKV